MLRIELKENKPGYAFFSARKWKGSNDIEIAVQHSQNNRYFADKDSWVPEIVWHKVPNLVVEGDALTGCLGPWIVDELINQGGNVRFLMQVRDSSISDSGPIAFNGNILASSAGGSSERGEDIREIMDEPIVDAPEPIIVSDSLDEIVTEIAEVESVESLNTDKIDQSIKPNQKKNKLAMIAGLILLLVAIVVAVFFFLQKQSSNNVDVGECSVANSDNELTFIQNCLKTKPNNQSLFKVIDEAKKLNKCGIAQRIYAHQSQTGNIEIGLAYAKEYEVGSSCFTADKDTAIYWYESVLANDPNNQEAKQRLAELKK